jgi:chromate transporter
MEYRQGNRDQTNSDQPALGLRQTVLEPFLLFLRLGLTSFGGPIAHLGYFRQEFVERRKWLIEEAFIDLVALCQFLPGPTSSQVAYSIGMTRGGIAGAIAAWGDSPCRQRLSCCWLPMVFAGLVKSRAQPGCTG